MRQSRRQLPWLRRCRPPATGPIPSVSGLKIVIPNATIRLGMFLQPQFESAQIPTANWLRQQSLSPARALRRRRERCFDNVEWFLETDSPNLFKGATGPATGPALKATSTMVIQDLFGTYKVLGDMLKIDAGYTLPAASHNALQSAFTLFGWDYFAYTFQNNLAFGAATQSGGTRPRRPGARLGGRRTHRVSRRHLAGPAQRRGRDRRPSGGHRGPERA